jgi:hypothetical protein
VEVEVVNDDGLDCCSSSATGGAREAAAHAARRRPAPSVRHAMRPGGRGPTVLGHDVWGDANDVFAEVVPTFFLTLSPSLADENLQQHCAPAETATRQLVLVARRQVPPPPVLTRQLVRETGDIELKNSANPQGLTLRQFSLHREQSEIING